MSLTVEEIEILKEIAKTLKSIELKLKTEKTCERAHLIYQTQWDNYREQQERSRPIYKCKHNGGMKA